MILRGMPLEIVLSENESGERSKVARELDGV
jgi:hypothetical protein